MKKVFTDTCYWVALINRRDPLHNKVKSIISVSNSFKSVGLITTDEVMVEFLTFFSSFGGDMRLGGIELVQDILDDPNVEVIP